jgi:hypothetical protein
MSKRGDIMSSSNTLDDFNSLVQELPDAIRQRIIDFFNNHLEYMNKLPGAIMEEYLYLADKIPPDNISLHDLLYAKAQEYIEGDSSPKIFIRGES